MNTNDWFLILFIILDGILIIDMILRIIALTGCCHKNKEQHVLTANILNDDM
jgi:hypothetical protein